MLFVTNRSPKQSVRSKCNRPITFDLQNTDVSRYLYFCERKAKDEYIEIKHHNFFERLKNDGPKDAQILLYIHGFNNNMESDIFKTSEKLQGLFNSHCHDPVIVVPVIWPCDDDSIAAIADDYWDDRRAADASAFGMSRLLAFFEGWREELAKNDDPCYRRINILAHSMGNRVFRGALCEWASKSNAGQMPALFRNVFMIAADVRNETLEPDSEGAFIPQSARNVFVYYAYDDFAMPASKVANLGEKSLSRRLGMTGPEDIKKVPKNVFELECSSFNNRFDFPKGHSYYLEDKDGVVSPIMHHMCYAIAHGRPETRDQTVVLQEP